MSDVIIRAENLGKKYTIGHQAENGRYMALRDVLVHNAKSLWNKTKDLVSGKPIIQGDTMEEVWALKDLNFEIKRGEAVGIIGRNGAGKSTLLKILSRITEPTTGRVTIKGRVASLLEVGTGFHPELSGRENIYLNGTILGMTRAEIKRKFDEIVAFAEVERYLDTPVKRYSSGMYVRLAFAVAAHLEPEILVVDEVLAVGDAQFQKKCLGKMEDVTEEGRTILFVSHNMQAINRLCKRSLLLQSGVCAADGESEKVVNLYLSKNIVFQSEVTLPAAPDIPMRLRKISVMDIYGNKSGHLEMSDPFEIEILYEINSPVTGAHVICFIYNSEGINILGSGDADCSPERLKLRQRGVYRSRFQVPAQLLGEDRYFLTVSLGIPFIQVYDRHEGIISFEIFDNKSRRRQWQHTRRPGILGLELLWKNEEVKIL